VLGRWVFTKRALQHSCNGALQHKLCVALLAMDGLALFTCVGVYLTVTILVASHILLRNVAKTALSRLEVVAGAARNSTPHTRPPPRSCAGSFFVML
jgi:hypothetical protein